MRNPGSRIQINPIAKASLHTCGALALALITLSCGNNAGRSLEGKSAPGSPTGVSSLPLFTTTSIGNFTCPVNVNVLPNGTSSSPIGPGTFTVCPNNSTASRILVHGQTQSSTVVCVFPALVSTSGLLTVQREPTRQVPWYQCVDISQLTTPTDGAQFELTGVTFNAAFIMEGTWTRA